MSNIKLTLDQLIVFHEDVVTRQTATNYEKEMEKAKTPFIVVEELDSDKYNVIGGFKYIDGLRFLGKNNIKLYCTVIDPFPNEVERLLATLQRCLVNGENIKYKEILIHELTKTYKLSENDIAAELGQDAKKIIKYMYNQIIPQTYLQDANDKGLKPLIQAIYLVKGFQPFEKRLLTELALYPTSNFQFKSKHIPIYKRYRDKYTLFSDFSAAKKQVIEAMRLDRAENEYWEKIPHASSNSLYILTPEKKHKPIREKYTLKP